MIPTKKDLFDYLNADARANYRRTIKTKLYGDHIWKLIVSMRKMEYYSGVDGIKKLFTLPFYFFHRYRFGKLSLKLSFSIPYKNIGSGFSIAHYGTVVINGNTIIGKNCRIQEGVTIGSTNGSDKAPVIGDNVYIASGAKVIGDITIADDVCIAANAVVVKSINEPGTTWGGVPAKKISNNNSHSNLSPLLGLN